MKPILEIILHKKNNKSSKLDFNNKYQSIKISFMKINKGKSIRKSNLVIAEVQKFLIRKKKIFLIIKA